ncbi:hypothetical protein GCM10020000_80560 [Streptomyces olivoverticillatus]
MLHAAHNIASERFNRWNRVTGITTAMLSAVVGTFVLAGPAGAAKKGPAELLPRHRHCRLDPTLAPLVIRPSLPAGGVCPRRSHCGLAGAGGLFSVAQHGVDNEGVRVASRVPGGDPGA